MHHCRIEDVFSPEEITALRQAVSFTRVETERGRDAMIEDQSLKVPELLEASAEVAKQLTYLETLEGRLIGSEQQQQRSASAD